MGTAAFTLKGRSARLTSRAIITVVSMDAFEGLAASRGSFLHARELAFFEHLEHLRRQRSYLVGRYAAKVSLCQLLEHGKPREIAVEPGCFGQPVVAFASTATPGLSLSHDDALAVAVAFSDLHVVGVDVETVSGHSETTMRSVLTGREIDSIARGDRGQAPYAVAWTAREALSKALRCGLLARAESLETAFAGCTASSGGAAWVRSAFTQFPAMRCDSWVTRDQVLSMVTPCDVEHDLCLADMQNLLTDPDVPSLATAQGYVGDGAGPSLGAL